MGAYYFLACLLPPLPSALGEKLPVSFPDLARTICRHIHPADEGLLRAYLSTIDAANWENLEQGRDVFLAGGTLSREELTSKRNLPEYIQLFLDEKERGIRRVHLHDRLWELCYSALLAQARDAGCRYLLAYLPWEIDLRNHLAALRFRGRNGNGKGHAILPGIRAGDFTALLSALEGQKNPLLAERYLDGERLKQIYHCLGNDTFSLDALLAFISRAMIYGRWEGMQAPYDMNNILSGGGFSG